MTRVRSSNPANAVGQTYPRRILLAVAAHSPQIVTETIYALAYSEPAYIPTEVHVITTQLGAKTVCEALLSDHDAQINKLCADYNLPTIQFDVAHIHIISDSHGEGLKDVRTRLENAITADFISQVVWQLTLDASSSLVVSLSGGRRTMSYYVGYALSLYGRMQDRLTHVLVDEEYWFNREFFYPPPRSYWVMREDGSGFDASKVEVVLADIPFVRLREGLPESLLAGGMSFNQAVSAAQARWAIQQVQVNVAQCRVSCAGQPLRMRPAELAFYVWMLARRREALPAVRYDDNPTQWALDFCQWYERLHGKQGSYERVQKNLRGEMTKAYFDERCSRVNRQLCLQLGESLAQTYEIRRQGKYAYSRYGVLLAPETIEWLE